MRTPCLMLLALALTAGAFCARAADYPVHPIHHLAKARPLPNHTCYRLRYIYVRYAPRLATDYWVKAVPVTEPYYCD